jgi:hypothetical protein
MDVVSPDLEACRLYRLYVLHRLPQLLVLDWEPVTADERAEAKIRGQYAVKRKATETAPQKSLRGGSAHGKQEALVLVEQPTAGGAEYKGAFKGKLPASTMKKRTESKNSEGNRFIVDSQL